MRKECVKSYLGCAISKVQNVRNSIGQRPGFLTDVKEKKKKRERERENL